MDRPGSPMTIDASTTSDANAAMERSRTTRTAIIGVCILAGIAMLGGLVFLALDRAGSALRAPIDAVGDVATKVAEAAAPRIDIRQLTTSAIAEFRREGKIVPLSATIDARSTITSSKKVLGINLGDTTVDVRVPKCRVQYQLTLEDINEADFAFDASSRTWSVSIPAPTVDESMVDVPSAPSAWEVRRDVGWARLGSKSGDWCERSAREKIREAVVREARNPLLLAEARREGERLVKDLVLGLLRRRGVHDVDVQVAAH